MKKMNIEEFDKIIIRDGEVMEFYLNNEKYEGIVFETFNDYLASEFEVLNGVKNGIETIYYPSGIPESICTYVNGYLDGLTKIFSEQGLLEEESFFENGICIWHKLFNDRGNLIESFKVDDKK